MRGMHRSDGEARHARDTTLPAFTDVASVVEEPWLGGEQYKPPRPDFELVLTRYFVVDQSELMRKVALPAPPLTGRLVLTDRTELAWQAFLGGLIVIELADGRRAHLLSRPIAPLAATRTHVERYVDADSSHYDLICLFGTTPRNVGSGMDVFEYPLVDGGAARFGFDALDRLQYADLVGPDGAIRRVVGTP